MDISSPVPTGSRYTSGFKSGARPGGLHMGADWAPPKPGEHVPVYAVAAGTVKDTGNGNVLSGHTGNGVLIDHGKVTGRGSTDVMQTYYGHLSRIDVKAGEKVTAGQQIGLMGATGNATGVHLHLGVLADGVFIDPASWLAYRKVTPGRTAPLKAPAVRPKTYKIKKGDSLSEIAQQFGTTVGRLQSLNSIKNANVISAGVTIRVR